MQRRGGLFSAPFSCFLWQSFVCNWDSGNVSRPVQLELSFPSLYALGFFKFSVSMLKSGEDTCEVTQNCKTPCA